MALGTPPGSGSRSRSRARQGAPTRDRAAETARARRRRRPEEISSAFRRARAAQPAQLPAPSPPLEGAEVSRPQRSHWVSSQSSPWLLWTFHDGHVGPQNFSRGGPEVPCRVFYRTFFVGRHPWKVSGRLPGGPGDLSLAPFGSVWLRLAPFESLTHDSGFNFSQSGSSFNFSELIPMLRSLRLGLLNLPRMVKILELRTQRQIMEASVTGSIWLRLVLFGSVWLRGGFWISDLYEGFYSSFFGFTPVSW